MPKYKVRFHENYYAEVIHEVEADTEEKAIEIAEDLQAEHVTPPDDINFIDWDLADVE